MRAIQVCRYAPSWSVNICFDPFMLFNVHDAKTSFRLGERRKFLQRGTDNERAVRWPARTAREIRFRETMKRARTGTDGKQTLWRRRRVRRQPRSTRPKNGSARERVSAGTGRCDFRTPGHMARA